MTAENVQESSPIGKVELSNPTERAEMSNPAPNAEMLNPAGNLEMSNPTGNAEMSNPTGNAEMSNKVTNAEMSNQATNAETSNQAKIAEMSNPTGDAEMSNPTGNSEMSNQATNAEMSNQAGNTEMSNQVTNAETSNPTGNAETSNPTGNAEMSNPTGNSEMSNQATNAEMSNQAGNTEMSNQVTNAETSNPTGNAEMSNQATNAEMSNHATNTEMSNQATNAEMSNPTGNAEKSNPSGNAEMSNQAGNAETSNPTGNAEMSNQATNTEMSNQVTNAEMSNQVTNAETSNPTENAEMSNQATNAEMSNQVTNFEMSNQATNAEMSNPAPNAEMLNPAGKLEMSNPTGNSEMSNQATNAEMSNQATNAEMSNPAQNAEMLNPAGNLEMSNPTGNAEITNQATNAEISNPTGNAEMSNQATNTEMSNPTGNAEKSNQATNAEISNPTGNAEMSNQAGNSEMSNQAGNAEISNQAPNPEMSNQAGNAAILNPAENTEMSNQATNPEISNQAGNAAKSNPAGNVEMPNPTGNNEKFNEAGNAEISNNAPNAEMSNTAGNVEISNQAGNIEGSSQAANTETGAVPKTANIIRETSSTASRSAADTVKAATEQNQMNSEPNASNMKPKASSERTEPKPGVVAPETVSVVSTGSVSTSEVVDKAHNSPSQNAATASSNNLKTAEVNNQHSGVKNVASKQKQSLSENSDIKLTQSSVTENRSPSTDIVEAKPVVKESVLKKAKTTKKAASAIPATKKSKTSTENKILARLSKESMNRLQKLILSKTSRSKTIRRLALRTYVEKAREDGTTSESIVGETRLDQFQMDKFMKLKTKLVTKLIFGVSNFSDGMRKNALKVYLKLNLLSSDLEAKTKKDQDAIKVPIPGNVKVGENVAPWSQENENSDFPMQTHAKPIHPNFLQPQPDVSSTIKKDPEVQPTGGNMETLTMNMDSKKDKDAIKVPIPGNVKVGENVAPWSQANETSDFPMQTHAKPIHPNLLQPQPDVSSTIKKDPEVQPTGGNMETLTMNMDSKKDKNAIKVSIPGNVKVGENVAPWSQANENSDFPMQTHAKPIHPNIIQPRPDVSSTIRKDQEVQSTGSETDTMAMHTDGRSKKDKDAIQAPIPGNVKVGENVAPWSQANENAEFPMQTHAKPIQPNLIQSQPDIEKDQEEQPTVGKTNKQHAASALSAVDVKVGENVAPWSQENANSDSPMQTHVKPDPPSLLASMTSGKKDKDMQSSSIQPSQSENTVQDGQTSQINTVLSQVPEIFVQTSAGGTIGSQTEQVPASDHNVNSVPDEGRTTTKTAEEPTLRDNQVAGPGVEHGTASTKSSSNKVIQTALTKRAADQQTPTMNEEAQLQTAEVKTQPELDLDKPFSAPIDEQVLPVKRTDAIIAQDLHHPLTSSSFRKTSHVLSTGDHVHRKGTSSGGAITDRDISAVVSSFFYVPESISLENMQSPLGTSTFETDGKPVSDLVMGINHQASVKERVPSVSTETGQRANDLVNIPDWSKAQQLLSTNIAAFDNPLNEHISGMQLVVPMMRDAADNNGLNREQIPVDRNRVFSSDSFPFVSRFNGLASNFPIEQTSGIMQLVNRRMASPGGIFNSLGESATTDISGNTHMQLSGIHENAPVQPVDFSTVFSMDPLQSSTFMKTPNVVSTKENMQQKTPSSALISDRELASVVSSFFL
ncbi:uncharacterized protein LOC110453257 [Mizuhopecten yessoensis]|uniref:uncharacterized protein LOC110453257 n=1 Tax=Mizuhopecten yessoensis TaxID=6573 RepID=UPI000B45AFEF|nr:uncharacterized protein LOC110453257 [Mizuhopecten yessoensis]